MDPFASNEPIKFTQILRAKLRKREVDANDKATQLKLLQKRNVELMKQYELTKTGRLLDIQALEPEATWVHRLRLSESEQLRTLHSMLLKQTLTVKHPEKLSQDQCLARVLKFCLFLQSLKEVAPQSLERDYFEFKEQWEGMIKSQEKRDDLKITCTQIFHKKDEIMKVGIQKDFLEKQGFTYSDNTFDDLFVHGWKGIHGNNEKSTDSSSSDEEYGENDQVDAGFDNKGKHDNLAVGDNQEEPKNAMDYEDEVKEEPLDIESIDPSKINQFKFIIDKYLSGDQSVSILNTIDGYASLLNVLLSQKKNEEIQDEIMGLVGDHNFEMVFALFEKRDLIKEQCRSIEENLKKMQNQRSDTYQPKHNDIGGPQKGINIEFRKMGKGGKKHKQPNYAQMEQKMVTNYDILLKLGFDEALIGENKRLGLKEKIMGNREALDAYHKSLLMQHEIDKAHGTEVIEGPEQAVVRTQKLVGGGESKVTTEDNDDWRYVSIAPPPKAELSRKGLVPVASLPKFAQGAFSSTQHLNQIQSVVFESAFKRSGSLLVAAPTGAGKTNIALLTILREVSLHVPEAATQTDPKAFSMKDKQFTIVYIAPLKALASEIVGKFQAALSYLDIRVRECTGDVSMAKSEIAETHVIVATPEKWDVLTRKTDGMMNLVSCMILDEIHLLNDERGLVLECLVSRALTTGFKQQKPIRLVGLSATLPNYQDVAEFIGAGCSGTFAFDATFRPTPLKCSFYGVKELGSAARGNNVMNDIIFTNLVRILRMGKQVIIFVHQRAATYNTAMELIEILRGEPRAKELFECPNKGLVKREVDRSRNEQVKELFPHGFGVHHAGMLRKDRNLVEGLFHKGDIKVLVSTSTLAWGVNLPAYAVLIKGTKVYDSAAGAYKDVGVFDVQQIFGRAGRPQFDKEGEAIILTPNKSMDEYVKMMQNKQKVESHLDKGLDNCINAEIASGTICTISEGVQWLKKSYFYQRMLKNPHGYSINAKALELDPSGHMILLEKVTAVVEGLNRARLIRFNRSNETVYSTDMGRIASNYYINVETMSYFMSNLKPNTREEMLLYHLAQASEFKQLDARKEEHNELKQLVAECQYVEVDKGTFNEAHTKVQVLLEAYLKNRQIKTFSLISDMAYIVQNASRLLRAMFEIALQRNYAVLLKTTLAWCKILDKRMMPGSHIMRQFTRACTVGKLTNQSSNLTNYGYMKDDIIYRLEQFNLSMDDLYEKNLDEAGQYLHPTMREEMYKFASYVPYLDMEVSCQPITRSIMKVQLTITAQFNWSDRWNGKSEPFWIIVDNQTEVMHQEFFQLQKKDVRAIGQKARGFKNDDTIQLTFFIPYQVPEGQNRISEEQYYSLEIISDRWYNLSFFKDINLSDMCVPDEDYPHTKLLPLRPMAVTALGDPAFEGLYNKKFSFFNPIQTQIFHTLFHTDSNVLIGAPTGSGKTIMSEFAMLRVFKQYPEKKIIYIAPLKALAKERIIDWKVRMGSEAMKKCVLELTGDCTPDLQALKQADILITTPEKWDGISRNWQHRSYVSDVALVVIDEIHLLGQDRGPVIEVIVSRMRYIAEQTGNNVRFVGLSTALANAKDVADWLGIHKLGLFNFKPSVRPVPIKVFFDGFSEKHYCPRMATMNKPAFKAIMNHSRDHPTLVFVSSRRQTRLTALDLLALCAADQQEKIANDGGNAFLEYKNPFLHMDPQEIATLSEFIKDDNLRHTIQYGVGMHHAGLAEGDRKIVEDLFVKKKIQILVTTSTLAWGVNFPARLVVVKGTEFFDPKLKRYVDFPLTDLLQMIGRAGRPGFDEHGIACIMVSEEKKNFYKKFLYEPFPVESSLASQLTDHLNAEIASGTLSNRNHCHDYLTWTYFFRRLTKNPTFYNLDGNDANAVNAYIRTLINTTLFKLKEAGCIELDFSDDSIRSTQLGYIASFYYLSHQTVQTMQNKLQENTGIDELIDVLSKAEEFAGLPVRHNEDVLNEALAQLVPLKVPKHDMESPHVKSNLLLQAHFERSPLPITDFITDTKSVLDQSIRVLQGMIDISAHKGYLQTSLNLVHLLQMLVQGQWLDQSPFLNIPHFTEQTISKLGRIGIEHLAQLINVPKLETCFSRAGIRFDQQEMKEIQKVIDKVPIVQVRWTIVKVNELNEPQEGEPLEEGGEAQFVINLKRVNQSNSQVCSINNFPKHKEVAWFLLIANPATGEVSALKRMSFKRFTSQNLVVMLPDDFAYQSRLKIYLMCDSYIGLDQEYTIDLNKVNDAILQQAKSGRGKKSGPKMHEAGEQKVKINVDPAAIGAPVNETRADSEASGDQFGDAIGGFEMYSVLQQSAASDTVGGRNQNAMGGQMLIASDGDGKQEVDSDSSFEFDVQPDDIYDLTMF